MAGIEPASERFDPRTSTSVAGPLFRRGLRISRKGARPVTKARKPSFVQSVTFLNGTLTFLRLLNLRSGSGIGRRHPVG